MTKANKTIINLLLSVISTGVFLILAELTTRYLYRDITTTLDNTSYFSRNWRENNSPIINTSGFREREFSRNKPIGIYRIAVIGDSFTYGQGIAEEMRFTNLLEQRLNDRTRRYEVLNFGRPGAETVDHLEILDTYVLDLSPDFVILQWFVNDVEGHDKSGRPKPHRLLPSSYLAGLLHRNSALYYLINTRWAALQTNLGIIESHDSYMTKRFSNPDSEDSQAADKALETFILRLKTRNIPVGIVMFPRLVETEGMVDAYPYDFLFERILNQCKRHDIKCLDLRHKFSRISPAEKLWASRLDYHPGPLANRITTEAILEVFSREWGQ